MRVDYHSNRCVGATFQWLGEEWRGSSLRGWKIVVTVRELTSVHFSLLKCVGSTLGAAREEKIRMLDHQAHVVASHGLWKV